MRTTSKVSRRQFLKHAPLTAAIAAATPGLISASQSTAAPDFCLFLGDHWSYTGIGWSWGLKSCAQSITDCCDMADYHPSVKTGINLDAHAYELVAKADPEVIARLKPYLQAGRVEIIGGSYGQPMGAMCSGESNLHQLVMGQRAIQKSLGVTVSAFLEEEEFSHPQLPQLLRGSGYRFASTAQCNTWGRHGSPDMDLNAFAWCSPDGTSIPTTPHNKLVFHPPVVTHDIDWLWSEEGRKTVADFERQGTPLAIKWVEFGWGPHELDGGTANQFFASMFRVLSERFNVRYTTLTEYLETYGKQAKAPVTWRMDDFRKLEPWGVGGDQLRRKQRETEAAVAAAERFDAGADVLGLKASEHEKLEEAWKHLLISQSHDVSLCEDWADLTNRKPEDWLSDSFVKEFIASTGTLEENRKVTTWGALGFRHLEVGEKMARTSLDSSLAAISAAIDTQSDRATDSALIVFNACGATQESAIAVAGVPLAAGEQSHLIVRDAEGKTVTMQVLNQDEAAAGSSATVRVAFEARNLPGLGYATYSMAKSKASHKSDESGLRISANDFHLENEFISLKLDAKNGAISSFYDRGLTRLLGRDAERPFAVLNGRTNRAYPGAEGAPAEFDSRNSRAEIVWTETGPLRATVKATHRWPMLRFEQSISLAKGQPFVDIRVRLFADVPPPPGEGKINGWQFPLEIEEGYWLTFAPGFTAQSVIRDFPFGVEPCAKDAIDAFSFIDLVGPQASLLIVHSGTQYFKRGPDNTFSNLLIREWNSHFNPGQYGWPREAEYRYRLLPHGSNFTNADRLRAVEAFDHQPICRAEPLHAGKLAKRQSLAEIDSKEPLISSFHATDDGSYELRVIERQGATTSARVAVNPPLKEFAACDYLGNTTAAFEPIDAGAFEVKLTPWQVKTFKLRR